MKILKSKTVKEIYDVEPLWVRKNFTNGKEFVASRNKFKMKVPKCGACGKSLDVDEMLHLAAIPNMVNQLIHASCVSATPDETRK